MSWTVSGSLLLPKADSEESEEEEATDAPEEAGDQWFIILFVLWAMSAFYSYAIQCRLYACIAAGQQLHSASDWNDRVNKHYKY